MRSTEAGRGSNVPSDGITPGADRDLGAGQGRKSGDNRKRYSIHRLARVTPCGRLLREGSAYGLWRPAWWGCPSGRLLRAWAIWRVEAGAMIKRSGGNGYNTETIYP